MILITTGVERTASTWLEAIFLAIREEFDLQLPPRGASKYREALTAGGLRDDHIYIGVFLKWDDLDLGSCKYPYRILHVQRDPRDILVSRYYSLRESHVPNPIVDHFRPILRRLSFEDGLLKLLDNMEDKIEILLSYLEKSDADGCRRYEFSKITASPLRPLREFLRFSGLSMSDARIRQVLEARDFRALSGGRNPGEERVDHHYRCGTTGSWRKILPPRVVEEFRDRFGESLIRLGYEKDLDWIGRG